MPFSSCFSFWLFALPEMLSFPSLSPHLFGSYSSFKAPLGCLFPDLPFQQLSPLGSPTAAPWFSFHTFCISSPLYPTFLFICLYSWEWDQLKLVEILRKYADARCWEGGSWSGFRAALIWRFLLSYSMILLSSGCWLHLRVGHMMSVMVSLHPMVRESQQMLPLYLIDLFEVLCLLLNHSCWLGKPCADWVRLGFLHQSLTGKAKGFL